jgi:sodium transport system permease protein
LLALLRYELLGILRDRRTLLVSIVLPIFLLPLLVNGLQHFSRKLDQQASPSVFHITIGGTQAETFRQFMANYSSPLPGGAIFRELPPASTSEGRVRQGYVDLSLEVDNPPMPTTPPRVSKRQEGEARLFRQRQPGRPVVKMLFAANIDRSVSARNKYEDLIRAAISHYRDEVLAEHHFDSADFMDIKLVDTADPRARNRAWLASLLPVILLALLVSGASVPAVDSLAGERERGTWETLLTSCLSRFDIVAAKQASILLVATVIATTQILNILFNWHMGWLKLPEGFNLDYAPASIWIALGLALVQANLVSSVLLYASARSHSFKEAQLLFFPVFILCLAFGTASLFPDLSTRTLIIFVPMAGLNVLMRAVLLGHFDLGFLLLGTAVNVVASLWFSRATLQRLLHQGDGGLVEGGDPEEQKRLNLREQIGWVYALMAAALLIVPGNVSWLANLTGQVVFNQTMLVVVVLWLLQHNHIGIRRGLRLHRVPMLVWPLALTLGPLLQLCANGLVVATHAFLPIPDEMTREMTKLLLPEGTSIGMLILMVALTPAICEEIAFRGLFMYAYLPSTGALRAHPVSARLKCAALVGIVFGAFHLSIYRFLPTAVIGAVLTLLAIQCNSILPGMLVHFSNNGLAIIFERLDVDLMALPGWLMAMAWPVSAFLIWEIGRLCRIHRAYQDDVD